MGLCGPILAPVTLPNTCNSVGSPADQPVHTITTAGNQILATANLIQYHTEQSEDVRANGLDTSLPTVDASNRYGLTAAHLVEFYGNGQAIDPGEPMHTVTSHDREALVATHIVKFKGPDIGQRPDAPLQTVTAINPFALASVKTVKYAPGTDLGYWPQIRALLNRCCGYALADDEILLLWIRGAWRYICDISMRMLTPRELYNAMGFPPDYIIEQDYTGKPYPKYQQVARCGNAVCPQMASAVVRVNFPEWAVELFTMAELEKTIAI